MATDDDLRYDEVRSFASHNSYSGDIKGKRHSLEDQLTAGLRCIEFDFHDDGYVDPNVGDYRVGHFDPGKEVDHTGGNPTESLLLTDWLQVLTDWSATKEHGPITVVLDAKDALSDNDDGGDIADLNSTLKAVFRAQLYTRDDYDLEKEWPLSGDLKNRFLCVLSGDMRNRNCYRWSFGKAPALGVNAAGNLVMAFAEDSGDLVCWSGLASAADEAIAWQRRYTYANSNKGAFEPAIAISDEGWIVTLHRISDQQKPDGLHYRLGRLKSDRIEWFDEDTYALGNSPTLSINGTDITAIHTQSETGTRKKLVGAIDTKKKRIKWGNEQTTQQKPFPTDSVEWEGFTISCGSHRIKKWLGCRFDSGPLLPARFEQLAFVEMQGESQRPDLLDPLFFAAPADSADAIGKARKAGLVARGWAFGEMNAKEPADPKENFAATDFPFASWYEKYMQKK